MASMYGKVMKNRFNKALVLIRNQAHNQNWCRNTVEAINHIESLMALYGLVDAYEHVTEMTRLIDDSTDVQAELHSMYWNIYWLMYMAQFDVKTFNSMWRQLSVDL